MMIKKYYFTFFVICAFIFSVKAQSVFNTELLFKLKEASPTELIEVLVLMKSNDDTKLLFNAEIKYKVGNIYSIKATSETIKKIAQSSQCVRIEYTQHHLKLMDDTALVRNRITDVHLGTPPLSQTYDGTGILMGFIDSGIDFNHPDLRDANGNSRVSYLWDMNKPLAANTPTPFGYGQEWNNTQINLGQANSHSDAQHFGHGTTSAGIAAGNGFAINKHEGSAPKAEIMMVALDFNKTGFIIADAVQYLVTKAQQLNKPLIINASVGEYYGSHDGTDLETQVINALVGNVSGRALIASAGNAGRDKFHVGYDITALDTNFTWIKALNSFQFYTEYADTLQIKNVYYSVGVNSPNFSNRGNIGFKPYNYALNTIKSDTIYNNSNRIGIVESISSINSFGTYELLFRIKPDSINYLWRMEHTGNGHIDAWSYDHVITNIPNTMQYPAISNYKKADTLQTICTGFQCSPQVITVGNYVNRTKYTDVNLVSYTTTEVAGEIAHNSSTGPTRQNAIKPDIVASGNTIFAPVDSVTLATYTSLYPNYIIQGGYHMGVGGTSASAPVVAGIAALYFQKHPTATVAQLKQAITNCAYNDIFTTTTLPNYRWGYGKIDAFKTMLCGEITNVVNINNTTQPITVFPNPFENKTTIHFNNTLKKQITLYNVAGELILSDECNEEYYILHKRNIASGLYFLTCKQGTRSQQLKIIVL